LFPKVMALSEKSTPSAEELKDTQQPLQEDELRPKGVYFCSRFRRGRLYHFGLVMCPEGDRWLLIEFYPAHRYMR
jgi:hypothetical protein